MKQFLFIFLTIFALTFAACTNSDEENSINLSVNITNLIFSSEAGSETISINAPDEWTAQVDNNLVNDWCTISPSKGFASYKFIYINVTENTSSYERSASLIIKSKSQQQVVEITQKQKDAIVIAKDSYTVDYAGGEIDIEVGHNVDFDIEISHDWITTTSTRAFETETLTFNIAANNNDDSREGTIKFISKDKAITQTVTVVQMFGTTKPRNNEIWYTSTNGKIVTPYRTNVFGARIVANTYENGKGVITFDGSVTTIGDRAFDYCSSLKSVTIPDSVTAIGGKAFQYCSSLTSITIPNSVTTIGDWAFLRCSSLTSITIPDSVTTIGGEAFYDCSSLTSITIPDSVTTIGYWAFRGCSSLTSVTIGNSVTTIGDSAFGHCSSLTSITIPDSVTTIGNYAFSDCSSLKAFYGKFAADNGRCLVNGSTIIAYAEASGTTYTIPDSVTEIGDYAFAYCSSLTTITIPDSVTEIGWWAFAYCSSLTNVTIGNSVTTIGEYAFGECNSLTSVTIGNSVTTIGEWAFFRCSSLKEFKGKFAADGGRCLIKDNTIIAYAPASGTTYTIPDSVTTIGYWAFCGCSSLTSVTIPDSVTQIGSYAFEYCSSLTSVYCKPTTPPSGSSMMFSSNASGRKIYVPKNSVAAYKAASGWKNYADAIVGYDF